ncbi:MAG: Nif3-like dinuclear metal center hexameric protein [Bacteroidales bacterium]|nr:Nif3-like dinuclear metal center hexameric protein [Bacteroidales bacterium]MBN2750536.1 Nif3-like dinuclear metal center hexameric protein [Bacteroidales bacterium]
MRSTGVAVRDVASVIETLAPLAYQEGYDNAGLIIGDPNMQVTGVLVTLDVVPATIDEAIASGANLIVAHHPVIFSGLKRITGRNYVEQVVIKAIQANIAIYAAHTNLDSVPFGVNSRIADIIGLTHQRVLDPLENQLVKLAVFVPAEQAEPVRGAMFSAGAGSIGNYDCCSFNLAGTGTFRAGKGANPFVGAVGEVHAEAEVRVEVIVPKAHLAAVVSAMKEAHPYEEVAYDLYPLLNAFSKVGLGIVGDLPNPMGESEFLQMIKERFGAKLVRTSPLLEKEISRVALCGGSGASLLGKAIAAGAQVFVSADFKYHQFFDADNKIVIADIGHYESEQFTMDIFCEYLSKKIPNFAVLKTKHITNPINYF